VTLLKRDRKADPARDTSSGSGGSVQDIISGIVQLLGGKVNLHTANPPTTTTSKPSVVPSGNMRLPPEVIPPRLATSQPHPSRINNRAPPRLNPPVPFEAIPLEIANSGQLSASKPPISVKVINSSDSLNKFIQLNSMIQLEFELVNFRLGKR